MSRKIAVIGLGYVGLPLALAFTKLENEVIAFDVNTSRITQLKAGFDKNGDVEVDGIENIKYTNNSMYLEDRDFYIVAVPTPVDEFNKPDLSPLINASNMLGKFIKPNDIVVYESTVYPGVTEDICGPILESYSGLKSGEDFFLGYSPERINPGDKEHTFEKITKVVAGQTPESTKIIDEVYSSVIKAGTFVAKNIKTAEAAKVIENTQRDINIGLMNELSMLFRHLDISIHDVLEAANTKWNFLDFKPGLVGGHCIGVDPYYLTFLADKFNFHPRIISSGRRINDGMAKYITEEIIKELCRGGKTILNCKVNLFGITFKENCSDIRNSKVKDIYNILTSFGCRVELIDPYVNHSDFEKEYGSDIYLYKETYNVDADCNIFAVAHDEFKRIDLKQFKHDSLLVDIKNIFPDTKGKNIWKL